MKTLKITSCRSYPGSWSKVEKRRKNWSLFLRFTRNELLIIEEIIKSVRRGEVIICPTDTVYGLIADATNKKAIKKVLKIKERKSQKPIPIFVKDIEMARSLAQITKKQEKFLKNVWPGKATMVFKKREDCSLFNEVETIGLRIPNHKLVNVLLKKINRPLTGTSANISGKPASTKIKEVLVQFKNQKYRPDLIIDAGNLEPSKPSTVIDLTKSTLKILRAGGLSKKELLKTFKDENLIKKKN